MIQTQTTKKTPKIRFPWRSLAYMSGSLSLVLVLFLGTSLGQNNDNNSTPNSTNTSPTPNNSANSNGNTENTETPNSSSGTPPTTNTAGKEHPETLLDFAFAGGALMIPIGLCSVILVAFIIERWISTRKSVVLPRGLSREIENLKSSTSGSNQEIEPICNRHPSIGARILVTAEKKLSEPREELAHAVNTQATHEFFKLKKFTRLFVVIAGIAPLLGLLGTVTGMIQAFREVAIEGLGSGQALAPGIYQALITTAAGLLVAIPAMLAYHWIHSRIDNYIHAIDELVEKYVDNFKTTSSEAA